MERFARSHPATPWPAKALAAFVVAYALSPIDLIPDFIPVLGYVDDVLLLPALIWLALRWLPPQVHFKIFRTSLDVGYCVFFPIMFRLWILKGFFGFPGFLSVP